MSPSTAASWTCEGCAVSVSRIDGALAPLPPGLEVSAEGRFCLLCSRSRAAEAALASASATRRRIGAREPAAASPHRRAAQAATR